MTLEQQVADLYSKVQALARDYQRVAQEAWKAPASYSNGWGQYAAGWSVGYIKDSAGFVHLRGMISAGTIGQVAFVLPAGYRPAQYVQAAVDSNGAFGRVRIDSSGNVLPQAGNNAFVSLDCITFRAEG